MTHIHVDNRNTIGSDNGLLPGQRQAINWTNAEILLIGLLGTYFSEISIEILTFPFKKSVAVKWRPFCLGPNVLIRYVSIKASCVYKRVRIDIVLL